MIRMNYPRIERKLKYILILISFVLVNCQIFSDISEVSSLPTESTDDQDLSISQNGTSEAPHETHLPIVTTTGSDVIPENLIRPEDLAYVGAFRLPDGPDEFNWEYSGVAMTYFPDGDIKGPADGFPGSLYGT
jgi:hypothetical protein